METLEQLRAKLASLESAREQLEAACDEVENQICALISSFKVGDIIEDKRGRTIQRLRIISMSLRWDDGVDIRGVRILKNGKRGNQVTVYKWDLEKYHLVERPQES